MMKNLLYAFLFLASVSVSAQLTVPDDIAITADVATEDVKLEYPLTLEGQDSVWVQWEIVLGENTPIEWDTYLCDNNNCYFTTARRCPSGQYAINRFYENMPEIWAFHTQPKGVAGSSTVTMKVYYLDYNTANHTPTDFTDVEYDGDTLFVDSHSFDIVIEGSNAVSDIDLDELTIYPNPATDFIQIKSDEHIAMIGIYNVVGKRVEMMNHTKGESHDVSELNNGMYLVRLMDDEGQVVKTMKLNKQ